MPPSPAPGALAGFLTGALAAALLLAIAMVGRALRHGGRAIAADALKEVAMVAASGEPVCKNISAFEGGEKKEEHIGQSK